MKKMQFEEPEMEVVRFNAQELITTTSGGCIDSSGCLDGVEQPTPEQPTNPDPLA